MSLSRPRIAVVSPFLDRHHGTERCIIEQMEALADEFEFHVYSTRMSDISRSKIIWHPVPDIPCPHLLKYISFFILNHIWRWFGRFSGTQFDLTYSPGINCLDADLIAVHAIFANLYSSMRKTLSLKSNSLTSWPRVLHRRIFYKLVGFLERHIYTRQDLPLVAVSAKTRGDLKSLYGRSGNVFQIYSGIDPSKFNPSTRLRLREEARTKLGYAEDDFVLLLIGNDWSNKGLPCLLEAVRIIGRQQLRIAAVGTDSAPHRGLPKDHFLADCIKLFPPRSDPEFYYAAADAYVGPSREDAFGMPPLEAMACGLPVVASRRAGVSELIQNEANGCILDDPENAGQLAGLICRLYEDRNLGVRLARAAATTASDFTWQQNADQLRIIFNRLLAAKQGQSVPEAGTA